MEHNFSFVAEEMHAGVNAYEGFLELMAELNREDASEAMAEARGNDGVSVAY